MQIDNRRIKVPVLIPLGLAILVLLASSIIGAYLIQRHNYISRIRIKVEGAQLLFNSQLSKDAQAMNGLLDFIKDKTDLQQAWQEKDRDKLLQLSRPLFEELRSKYKVTHLYFTGLDRICFLRTHNPAKYGDYISRITMNNAVKQQQPIWGIELGTYGTFTLRVIHPWRINGQLAGYIELGEEIEHILPILKDLFKTELCVVINKQYITRKGWEEGMRIMRRKDADWNLLPDDVIADSTFTNLTDKSLGNINKIYNKKKSHIFDVTVGGRNYKGELVPLLDAGKRHVGDLVVMKDIAELQADLKMFSIALTLVCITIGVILYTMFYLYLRKIEINLTNVYSSLHDQIEKRKCAENELKQAYDQMELKVHDRTSELRELNEKLETAVDKLTSANHDLEQFAFIASHHLREPVRKISLFGKILIDSMTGKMTEEERENCGFMIDGADRIMLMVKGLKLYFEASVEKIKSEDTDLNLVIERIKKVDLPDELGGTNAAILIPEKLPVVTGSSLLIGKILRNIIENSLKYHKKGIPTEIIIRAYKHADNMLRVEVEDNGIGIKENYLKNIFDPFRCLHTGGDFKNVGIGIGLTVCKMIVHRHGGRIGVRSVYDHGTTLWFTLPLAASKTKPAPALNAAHS